MRSFRYRAGLVALLAAVLVPGCFAVANIDRFDFEGGVAATTRDYSWQVTGLSIPHMGSLFEMHVVDTASRRVAAAVVYDGIPDETTVFVAGTLTDALAPGHYEARFWADLGSDRTFAAGTDHAWIVPVPDDGAFAFVHARPFDADVGPTDDPGQGNVVVRLADVGTFAGSPLIVRVRVASDPASAEIGYYRLDAIPATAGSQDLTLSDIAENDSSYFVHAFVDMNSDGQETAGEPVFDPAGQAAMPDAVFNLDLSAPTP